MNPEDDNAVAGSASASDDAVWRLDLCYEGTAFHGWARQPSLRTVEAVLGEALATVLREPVWMSVAGRTDAGVHAAAQVVSFACSGYALPPARLRHSLNALLPDDVAVLRVSRLPAGFVAREARSRTYRYRVLASPVRPVHDRAFLWHVRGALDAALLHEAAALLPGERDFSALTPSAHAYHHCTRTVASAAWRLIDAGGVAAAPGDAAADGDEWVFEIRATSFLHNMVRVAVGSMIDVAQGRMTTGEFATALAGSERANMGQTAPASGLTLMAVEY